MTKEKKREYDRKYYQTHKEHKREYNSKYRQANREKLNKEEREYHQANKEKLNEYSRRRYRANQEREKKRSRKYYQANREMIAQKSKQKRQKYPEKVREKGRKHQDKRRRNLGYIPFNKWFKGCEFHHLDRDSGIYIPKWLHRAYYHNQFTGQGMDKINDTAIRWWMISQCRKPERGEE